MRYLDTEKRMPFATVCIAVRVGIDKKLGMDRILRPIDNGPSEDALSQRYTAEKSGLW
jgi:hypothetical protein